MPYDETTLNDCRSGYKKDSKGNCVIDEDFIGPMPYDETAFDPTKCMYYDETECLKHSSVCELIETAGHKDCQAK